MIFEISLVFLFCIFLYFLYVGKVWANTPINFLYANRSLKLVSTAMAINSHWFWAIALFVAPAAAYNWGIIGLLWFVLPNAFCLIITAALTHRIRNLYPDGYSLTEYIKNNFSRRVSIFYQISFTIVSLAGILLAFTAINKFFAFAGLGATIDPIYASLAIGLITLAFTAKGGIRTSIYTGVIQTTLWGLFLGVMLYGMIAGGFDYSVFGKNELTTVFDEKFLTTFGLAYLGGILLGSASHGAFWQKSFSMPKENIWPSYIIAFFLFSAMVFALGSFGLYAQAHALELKAPELSSLVGIMDLYGPLAITAFGVLLIGQTSTVIDSCLNYIGSLISREWVKKEDTTSVRIIMVAFFFIAWLISWSKIEVWSIFMFMSAVRASMFIPMVFQIYQIKMKEAIVFYGSIVTISGALYILWMGRLLKNPTYDMYFVSYGLVLSLLTCLLAAKLIKQK